MAVYVNKLTPFHVIRLDPASYGRRVEFSNAKGVPDGEYFLADQQQVEFMEEKLKSVFDRKPAGSTLERLGEAILFFYRVCMFSRKGSTNERQGRQTAETESIRVNFQQGRNACRRKKSLLHG